MATLLSISADIQLLVLDLITRPSDLKSLCLACKHLRAIATPRLYHTISLDVRNQRKYGVLMRALCAGGGRNLCATRELILLDLKSRDEKYCRVPTLAEQNSPDVLDWTPLLESEDQIEFMIDTLIRTLPENTLNTFRFLSDSPTVKLSQRCRDMLGAMQGNLRHVQMPMQFAKFSENLLSMLYTKRVEQLESLNLVCSADGHDLYTGVLWKFPFPKLKQLCVQGKFISDDIQSLADYMRRDSISVSPSDALTSLKSTQLAHLDLRYVNLETFGPLLLLLIEKSALKSLTIRNCTYWATFLTDLEESSSNYRQTLRRLCVQYDDGFEADLIEDDLFNSCSFVEHFISTISGLEELYYYPNKDHETFTVDEMIKQGKTLKTLGLNLPYNNEFSNDAFLIIIVESCREIVQLSLRFPSIEIDDAVDDTLCRWIDRIQALPELRVLHIQNLLSTDEEDPPSTRKEADSVLQQLADFIFRRFYQSNSEAKLQLVAFGTESMCTEVEDHIFVPKLYFARGFRTDMWGCKVAVGIPTSLENLRHAVPNLNLLEFDPKIPESGQFPDYLSL
ncbi:hypothetical protein BU16DRAFT_521366 [Lophium mytilinum]|uniref:Uncharacterized protein n=1 Tax=Lophium mytilinum TaxID=390894 RepID=A0A6A6RD93_9PEZI|nr:hypothetical protein BU16DRAFT_521366 [Lophium mytilinum]